MGPSDSRKILFSSFVAGALLVKKNIGFPELGKIMFDFEKKTDINFDEPNGDFDRLSKIVLIEDDSFKLIKDYSDLYKIENSSITIYDYLYNLTNYEIRQYFGIQERDDTNVYIPNVVKPKYNMLTKIKRTKVYI